MLYNDDWIGYKNSDRYNLDFLSLESRSFKLLSDSRQKEKLIKKIVDEIEVCIVEFKNLATKNNL